MSIIGWVLIVCILFILHEAFRDDFKDMRRNLKEFKDEPKNDGAKEKTDRDDP